MDVPFSSSYTDASPLGCDVPQSFALGPRLIFFLHLFFCCLAQEWGGGGVEQEMGAASASMRDLHRSVVVKKKLSGKESS